MQALTCAVLGGGLGMLHLAGLLLADGPGELAWDQLAGLLFLLAWLGVFAFPLGAVAGMLLYFLARAVGLREDRVGPYAVAALAGAPAALATGPQENLLAGVAAVAVCALAGFVVARRWPRRAPAAA